jgi:hypothetical protein
VRFYKKFRPRTFIVSPEFVEQQSKKRNRGNRGLSAGLPPYDSCIALVLSGIRQEKQWLAMREGQ